jgi:hypothetical protein
LARSASYEAPNYEIFSTLLSLQPSSDAYILAKKKNKELKNILLNIMCAHDVS